MTSGTPPRPPPSAAAAPPTRRTLLFYRVVTIGLLLVIGGLSFALQHAGAGAASPSVPTKTSRVAGPPAPKPKPPVQVIDLAARFALLSQHFHDQADASETYFGSRDGTVHMHALGFGQTCPLHIHRTAYEATVILSGAPEVLQIYGAPGAATQRVRRTPEPGSLIASPPLCGHKWINHDQAHMQANLVFASPPFAGNLYVEQDDPRLQRGAAPGFYEPAALLKRLGQDEMSRLDTLPIMDGKMAAWLLRGEADLAGVDTPRVVYVAQGTARLLSPTDTPLHSRMLVLVPPDNALRVRATEPSVLYVFTPGRRDGGATAAATPRAR